MNGRTGEYLRGKTVAVTGGCGSIGSELVRQLLKHGVKSVRAIDIDEAGLFSLKQSTEDPRLRALLGDVRDRARLLRAFQGVDLVFHAAALKHVPLCEYNPYEAVKTNVLGTQNVIESCIDCDVAGLVAISTDKAVAPLNTMGATKLLSEKLVLNAPIAMGGPKVCCVRFGNVMMSVGSVIPTMLAQARNGGPVTVTAPEMTRFFMSLPQAVSLVLSAAVLSNGGELFVLKMDRFRLSDLVETIRELVAREQGIAPNAIPIEIIGVRAGEKMHEDLLAEGEVALATREEGVVVVRSTGSPVGEANSLEEEENPSGRLLDQAQLAALLEVAVLKSVCPPGRGQV